MAALGPDSCAGGKTSHGREALREPETRGYDITRELDIGRCRRGR